MLIQLLCTAMALLTPAPWGRANMIYMTVTFSAAAGSMLGALTYYHGGWTTTALIGAGSILALLLIQATAPRNLALVEAG